MSREQKRAFKVHQSTKRVHVGARVLQVLYILALVTCRSPYLWQQKLSFIEEENESCLNAWELAARVQVGSMLFVCSCWQGEVFLCDPVVVIIQKKNQR